MDCCAADNSNNSSCAVGGGDVVCKMCESKAKSVDTMTIFHMLKNPFLKEVGEQTQYHFCESPDCGTVYFSNQSGQYFTKEQVRVRVGLKEREHPVHLCYCFDYTEQSITGEISAAGKSSAETFIPEKIKQKLCACEAKNPSGMCCLGSVLAAIKKIKARSV